MMEPKFYPQDFNGIVLDATAYIWPAMGANS
jgi:hypothetical protein